MPERRIFLGQQVKNARRIFVKGRPMIKVTFYGPKGQPGPQKLVTPEEYEQGVKRFFAPGKTTSQGSR